MLIVASAVGTISLTVTKTKIFKPLREWIKTKSAFLGGLFECPYCFSFYVAALFYIPYHDDLKLIVSYQIFDYITSYLSLVCFSSFFTGFIYKSISQIE